jgi:hypothetical protein
MLSLLLCIGALALVFWFTRYSLTAGLCALLTVGYFYGILRANVPEALSHFIFDAGAGGLYLGSVLMRLTPVQRVRIRKLRRWVICLVGWPILLFFIPLQDTMIQLVGLRGAIWFVPFLFFGAIMDDDERSTLAVWLAVLNLIALAFAVAEFSLGLEKFFPHNDVTALIYKQSDIIQGSLSWYRIPSMFVQQATYSATMVLTMPFLVGAWVQTGCRKNNKIILTAGMIAGMLGVFLGASRTQALILLIQLLSLITFAKIRLYHLVIFALLLGIVGCLVYKEPRLQRFTELDASTIENRVHGSVNESFLNALIDYPLGNGLGGGGTSIPYFLQDRLKHPVLIENEYGRILLETGIPGLMLWIGFVLVTLVTASGNRTSRWRAGWRLARITVAVSFATAFIGTGLMTAIPGTGLLLLMIGWLCAPRLRQFRIEPDTAGTWAYSAAG